MNRSLIFAFTILLAVMASATLADAQTTEFVYQGQLQNASLPANGSFDFEFLLYDTLSGGTQVGVTLTKNSVAVANGIFSVPLDFGLNFPGTDRFIEIHVRTIGGGAFTTLTPRQAVLSAPYSVKSAIAEDANQFNGHFPAFYLDAGNLAGGTLDPARLPVPLTLIGTVGSGPVIQGRNLSNGDSSSGVLGVAFASTGQTIGVSADNFSTGGTGVYGQASSGTGSTIGVEGFNQSTSGTGVLGVANATSGLTVGVSGKSFSTGGTGVYGADLATSGFNLGVRGDSASPNGKGVYGFATSATGITQGVWGENASTSGVGVYGVARSTSGMTTGVYGDNYSPDGVAVFGKSNATTGINFGVRGETYSTTGVGVYGYARDVTGTSFTIGVEGDSRNMLGGIGVFGQAGQYGVLGVETLGMATDYGVYADGNLGASGLKTFRIDHPNDPTNKYLLHYATESPEVINFYRGTVVLDSAGEAVVQLPPYFAKINKDPSYTLTAVGAPMPMLHVAQEIDEAALRAGAKAGPDVPAPLCSFRIAGGAPGAKVSWRIEAVRNDLWVRTQGAPVEVEKVGVEKGTYQHPDLYGQPADKGLIYQLHTDRPAIVPGLPVGNPSTKPSNQ